MELTVAEQGEEVRAVTTVAIAVERVTEAKAAATGVMMAEWKEQELRDMFSLFDDDRSGSIDMSELHQSLLELGLELGEKKLAKLAATADADASGQIDEAEFVDFFR